VKFFFIFDIFILQRFGGISKYIYEITKNFKSKKNIRLFKLPLFHFNENAKEYNFFINTDILFIKKVTIIINKIIFFILKIFFRNSYYLNSYFEIYSTRSITFVYDLIPELLAPNNFHKIFLLKRKKIITQSKLIITISENTKKDIINFYNIDPNKIKLIYPSGFTKEILQKNYRKKIEIDGKVISNFYLYVGNREGYKNFSILMEAAVILKKMNIYFQFVVYGGGKFNKQEIDFLKKNEIENNFIKIDGDEFLLCSLYYNAKCLIYPSKYEGFGLPLIEAFQLSCPVITTKKGSIPEVAQDAPLYFDPNDPYDLTNKLLDLHNYSKNKILKGHKISKKFNWDNSREQFKNILEEFYEKI